MQPADIVDRVERRVRHRGRLRGFPTVDTRLRDARVAHGCTAGLHGREVRNVDLIVPARKVRIREVWVGEARADVEEAWLRGGGYANGRRGDALSRGEGAHVVVR